MYRTGPTRSGTPSGRLTWVDRQGKPIRVVGNAAGYSGGLSLSPDDSRAAATQLGQADVGLGNFDVWIVDLARGVSQRLTSDATREQSPIWSPTADLRLPVRNHRSAPNLFTIRADGVGSGQQLFRSDQPKTPTSWSRDKRFILLTTTAAQQAPTSGCSRSRAMDRPVPMIQTKFQESGAHFSPNMQWIAYVSNLSGDQEVYVRPFNAATPAAPAASRQVSKGGGLGPRWRRDGELFYTGSDGVIMSVAIPPEGPSRAAAPTPLFAPGGQWDVASDGKRFLVAMAEVGLSPITVVLHWQARGRQ